jgi:hypothetical protein
MKKQIALLFILFLVNIWTVFSQSVAKERDKIVMKTGETYYGDIVFRNDEMLILQTDEGVRYQFSLEEVKDISKETVNVAVMPEKLLQDDQFEENQNFFAVLDACGGASGAKNSFDVSPNTQIAFVLGKNKVFSENFFVGLGAGYNSTYLKNTSTLNFLPVFLRLQNTFTTNRISPFVRMDGGYAFSMTSGWDGGVLVKAAAGISSRLSYKTKLFCGIYAGIQQFGGKLSETISTGTYYYEGIANMKQLGLQFGIQF